MTINMQQIRPITVNQLGYAPNGSKIAVFTGSGGAYEIMDTLTGHTVFQGETGAARFDASSGSTLAQGDFSTLTAPGRYRIKLASGETSGEFAITEQPYEPLLRGLLKGFYYYRCGTELTATFAGPWAHKACHLDNGYVHGEPERWLSSSGGWHDAGDYGKYMVAAAKAVADLLLAYELNPAAFAAPTHLPETDGKVPDVLHECRWELDFVLKLQDPHSGGVFHKLTTQHFPPLDLLPEADHAPLCFSPVSATATAGFAAVLAMASRIYRPFDSGFADHCLAAAVRAWNWLLAHPQEPGFTNPADVSTGEYGDNEDADERYWAAAELYRTTGEAGYYTALQAFAAQDFPKYSLGWADNGGYGTLACLLLPQDKLDAAWRAELLAGWLAEADKLVQRCEVDGYRISLTPEDYIWGSNMVVMNNAMLLLLAHHFSGEESYRAAALEHVHYLMGRNALDISYVSGFGDRPVRHMHYRPSVAARLDTAPGLVSGGPNAGLHDEYAKAHLQGQAPARCYVDHVDSYATNEVTIYWNSPAVFAVAMFVGP